MMSKERSSGQDNASREGVDAVEGARHIGCGFHLVQFWPNCYRLTYGPSSARTNAETPQADCPSSQSKDVT